MDEKVKEIKESMNQIELKKVWFGGYNKEDVQTKMDMMYAMFEKCYKEQIEKETEAVEALKRQIADMREEYEGQKRMADLLIVDLNKSISDLTIQKQTLEEEQAMMQNAYKEYCKALLKEYSESLCALSSDFSRVLENIAAMQKEINEERVVAELEYAYQSRKELLMKEE